MWRPSAFDLISATPLELWRPRCQLPLRRGSDRTLTDKASKERVEDEAERQGSVENGLAALKRGEPESCCSFRLSRSAAIDQSRSADY